MAEIINGVAFCNEETLVIHENESKILYQDLEQKIKNLAIKLENNSSLEILFSDNSLLSSATLFAQKIIASFERVSVFEFV